MYCTLYNAVLYTINLHKRLQLAWSPRNRKKQQGRTSETSTVHTVLYCNAVVNAAVIRTTGTVLYIALYCTVFALLAFLRVVIHLAHSLQYCTGLHVLRAKPPRIWFHCVPPAAKNWHVNCA
jgi:hypothetical protein